MAQLTIRPTDATVGAVVAGVDLASLDDATWGEIEAAFVEHAVLVFPGQHLSGDEQKAFGARFGAFERIGASVGTTPISNTAKDGRLLSPDDPVIGILRGNEGWHTDSSYMPVAAKASMLSARVVPPAGGETEWADMRAAYDALAPDVRARVDTMVASHSLVRSQLRMGLGHAGDDFYGFGEGPDPVRPLVKVHPVTGRRALFIGRHAYGIPGLDPSESEAFLAELLVWACRPPRVLTHRWAVGDLVVWDNRCVLHRVRPWDPDEPRVMVHTRISGDPVTEGV